MRLQFYSTNIEDAVQYKSGGSLEDSDSTATKRLWNQLDQDSADVAYPLPSSPALRSPTLNTADIHLAAV